MARIEKPHLSKTLVGNGNLRSGSCIGAHNTAVYWALHALGAKIVLISLMATVSALPATLFTLPAGAIADMVDRKKILLAVQLWHASIAIALAILWMAHLLNPYLILASAFLFSLGFAFSSPAQSAVFAGSVVKSSTGLDAKLALTIGVSRSLLLGLRLGIIVGGSPPWTISSEQAPPVLGLG